MNCPDCDDPLDVSATQPSYLRCPDCMLLFVVTKSGDLQPFAVRPPEGIDEDEFFASMTQRLGFEDEDEDEDEDG